jgi:HK97 family phage prohead protease
VSGSLDYGAPLPVAEVKAAGSGDGWEVAGYASTWDRDLGGDAVSPGAFAAHLASGAKVRFLYAHDAAQVLGRPLELREDDQGLFGRFRISQTRLGQDVHRLLTDGALDSFSIGFIPRDFERDEKSGLRTLKSVELVECSVVAMPMNPQATVTAVKEWDFGQLPLETLLEHYERYRTGVLGQAKAVAARRLGEGRRLSDPALATLERLRALCEEDGAELLRLATTPPAPKADDPAPVRTAGLVEAHMRRARLRELGRIYGVTTP